MVMLYYDIQLVLKKKKLLLSSMRSDAEKLTPALTWSLASSRAWNLLPEVGLLRYYHFDWLKWFTFIGYVTDC